jgi:ankyrin repeat protein
MLYIQNGQTPLILAVSQGHLDVVKYLIEERNAITGDTDNVRKFEYHSI